MGTLNFLSKDNSFFSQGWIQKPNNFLFKDIDFFIVVEAWSKVGLRGYHSNQKIIEQASMKVETSLKWLSEGMRDTNHGMHEPSGG